MCMFVMVGGKSSGNMQTPDRKDQRHSKNFKLGIVWLKMHLFAGRESHSITS